VIERYRSANPIQRPACWPAIGWDWYGYDRRSTNSSLLARINAKGKLALVISCVGFSGIDPSYVLLSGLFREWFPAIGRIDAPDPLFHPRRTVGMSTYGMVRTFVAGVHERVGACRADTLTLHRERMRS
jgi:hypothetical protein